MPITYTKNIEGADWQEMNTTLREDDFDNGRTDAQLQKSFENSHSACIAYVDGRIIGTARVLSDGVCNAYIVDVWTLSAHRRQGVARTMIASLLEGLQGQHVYLFTDDSADFYKRIGFVERPYGMELVVGQWLVSEP